jgi:flagellar biosynthesis chaperone FliJ
VNRRFRLASLERLRGTELDDAARALAAARVALTAAVATRADVAARIAGAVAPARSTPDEVTGAGRHREALRSRLADADAARQLAEQQLAGAVEAWRAARAGLRAVESLHDRHRAALVAAAARTDQLVLDDLAAQVSLRSEPSTRGGAR